MSRPERRAELSAAIDRATAVFAAYPRPVQMSCCAHCAPDHALTDDWLEDYAFKAVSTWGDAADLRHFLPTMLERSWAGTLGAHPAVVSTKLVVAGWRTWPTEEQGAVEDLMRALFVAELSEYPGRVGALGAIAAIAEPAESIRPHLDDWHLLLSAGSSERLAALLHLLDLTSVAMPLLAAGDLGGLLWTPRLGPIDDLALWLTGHTTLLQLERATFDFAGTPYSPALAAITEQVSRLRASLRSV